MKGEDEGKGGRRRVKENLIVLKSKAFALRIVKFYKYLRNEGKYVMPLQFLRSGTSIGANIAEGQYAQSKADFWQNTRLRQKRRLNLCIGLIC